VRRLQIYLDEGLDRQLRQRAAAEGRSAAAVIRAALARYLAPGGEPDGDDPIRAVAGSLHGLPADAAVAHDRQLYGKASRG
jgi:plasmid stability protein